METSVFLNLDFCSILWNNWDHHNYLNGWGLLIFPIWQCFIHCWFLMGGRYAEKKVGYKQKILLEEKEKSLKNPKCQRRYMKQITPLKLFHNHFAPYNVRTEVKGRTVFISFFSCLRNYSGFFCSYFYWL